MRFFLLGVGVLAVSGCAASGWSDFTASSPAAGAPLAAAPNFGWRLSGDRRVAPLQVFDDGRDVWLQFGADQAVPAIFARSATGSVAVSYRRQPPYIVVNGHWPGLVFQGGALRAYAQRSGADAYSERGFAGAGGSKEPDGGEPATVMAASTSGRATAVSTSRQGTTVATTGHAAASGTERNQGDVPASGGAVSALEVAGALGAVKPARAVDSAGATSGSLFVDSGFRIGPEDVTLRGGLARWARASGWTFDPQHWAVDVDIPVAGSAHFQGDFKTAVRALLDATTLAERPVQPCFYSNQVLRVVPHARSCQPAASMGGAA